MEVIDSIFASIQFTKFNFQYIKKYKLKTYNVGTYIRAVPMKKTARKIITFRGTDIKPEAVPPGVMDSLHFPHDTRVNVTLVTRLLLLSVAQKLSRCEHHLFWSKIFVPHRPLLRIEIFCFCSCRAPWQGALNKTEILASPCVHWCSLGRILNGTCCLYVIYMWSLSPQSRNIYWSENYSLPVCDNV
jgi:hypothetical protein